MIEVAHVTKRFGSREVFDDLSITITPGVTGLLGPNGAGKTTLLRCIATVLKPDAGHVSYDGQRFDTASGLRAAREQLGYLPQSPAFIPYFSASDMLRYIAILKLIPQSEIEPEVSRVLERVQLTSMATTKVRSLSGGMRQRLGVGQALLGNPKVVVLDEPTVGLDPKQRIEFRALVSEVGESASVILSTHQTEDVAALCERVLVFAGGSVRFDGTPTGLASVAQDHVWATEQRPESGTYWRTADGHYRSIGARPAGARPVDPHVEDGYLSLLDQSKAAS